MVCMHSNGSSTMHMHMCLWQTHIPSWMSQLVPAPQSPLGQKPSPRLQPLHPTGSPRWIVHTNEPQNGGSGSTGASGGEGTGRKQPTRAKHISCQQSVSNSRKKEVTTEKMTYEGAVQKTHNSDWFTQNSKPLQQLLTGPLQLSLSLTCSSLPWRHLKRWSAIERNEGTHASLVFTSSYSNVNMNEFEMKLICNSKLFIFTQLLHYNHGGNNAYRYYGNMHTHIV